MVVLVLGVSVNASWSFGVSAVSAVSLWNLAVLLERLTYQLVDALWSSVFLLSRCWWNSSLAYGWCAGMKACRLVHF